MQQPKGYFQSQSPFSYVQRLPTNSGLNPVVEYSKHNIIQPPKNPEEVCPYRLFRYIVDSRDRNINRYPSPSRYEVTLPDDIRDIVYVKLNIADIPFSRYLIHSGNNKLYVSEQADLGNVLEVALTEGEYETPSDLASEMATRLNAACNGTMTVTYNARGDKFAIQSDLTHKTSGAPIAFALLFQGSTVPYGPQEQGDTMTTYKAGTPARVIGFDNKQYRGAVTGTVEGAQGSATLTGVGTLFTKDLTVGQTVVVAVAGTLVRFTVAAIANNTTLTLSAALTDAVSAGSVLYTGLIRAPYRRNFNRDRYIVMNLDNVDLHHSITPILDKSFAIINSAEWSLNNDYSDDNVRTFNPPMASLRKLRIRFVDYDGYEYDFQNQDHRLELIFASLRNTRLYPE